MKLIKLVTVDRLGINIYMLRRINYCKTDRLGGKAL